MGYIFKFLGFVFFFDRLSNFISFRYVQKKSKYVSFYGGLRLFKGLRLLFLQIVPRGTFTQGATSILESRVGNMRKQSSAWRDFKLCPAVMR